MKKITFLTFLIFPIFNTQAQIIKPAEKDEKVKLLVLKPTRIFASPIWLETDSKDQFTHTWSKIYSSRFILNIEKPSFLFGFVEAGWLNETTEDLTTPGPLNLLTNDQRMYLEIGLGIGGTLPLWHFGLGLDGELTFGSSLELGVVGGISWTNKKQTCSFFLFNYLTPMRPGIKNLGFGGQFRLWGKRD